MVCLLATNNFKANNQILINNQLSADNPTITVEIGNVYGLGRQHISGATLNITVGIEKTSLPEEDSRTGSTFDLSTSPGSSNSGTVDASGWMWYDPFIIINSITINSNGKDGDSKIIADGSVICYSSSSHYDDDYVVYKPGCTIRLSRASYLKRFILDIYWKIEYNCKYNDGTNNSTTAYYNIAPYGTSYSKPAIPTRTGYQFKGYYTSGGDQIFNAKGALMGSLSMSTARPAQLYAQWEPNKYDVNINIYNPEGGEDYTTNINGTFYLKDENGTVFPDQYNETGNKITYDTSWQIYEIVPGAGRSLDRVTSSGFEQSEKMEYTPLNVLAQAD